VGELPESLIERNSVSKAINPEDSFNSCGRRATRPSCGWAEREQSRKNR